MPLRPRRTPLVVLLVQPHDDSREMYVEFFRHHGVTVSCADDAADALALAPSSDVVVTELQLSGPLDGYTFIERLRGDEPTRNKPILVVTSWAWQTERLRAEEAGCDLFLTKPCLPAVLLKHVRRAFAANRLRQVRGHDSVSSATDSHRPLKSKRTA